MLQFKEEDTEARIGKPAFDFRRPCTACAFVQPAVLHRAGTQVEVIFPFPDSLHLDFLPASLGSSCSGHLRHKAAIHRGPCSVLQPGPSHSLELSSGNGFCQGPPVPSLPHTGASYVLLLLSHFSRHQPLDHLSRSPSSF